jgi:hypothetical protein
MRVLVVEDFEVLARSIEPRALLALLATQNPLNPQSRSLVELLCVPLWQSSDVNGQAIEVAPRTTRVPRADMSSLWATSSALQGAFEVE